MAESINKQNPLLFSPKFCFTGLTWDHPRGYQALDRSLQYVNNRLISWHRQPLEGFESYSIEALAKNYDLLVLDHPHIGEAINQNCLLPLDTFFNSEQLIEWEKQSVGSSMKSYQWHQKQWALPLDVATQVMAIRADLWSSPSPKTWEQILQSPKEQKLALSLAGPHSFISLLSIAASFGYMPEKNETLLDESAFIQAFDILHQLYQHVPTWSITLNPIQLLEAMVSGDDINLIPLIFGYVNYTRHQSTPIFFTDSPVGLPNYHGSILGGTGIAISARAQPTPELIDYLKWLMSPTAQCHLIPENEGQPSHRGAWQNQYINQHSANFYQNTLLTTESALVRPRFNGYIRFQTLAADVIRQALAYREPIATSIQKIRHLWQLAIQPNQ
ncbi:TPA: extracellular solute-binding protein [Providencia rettgeri]